MFFVHCTNALPYRQSPHTSLKTTRPRPYTLGRSVYGEIWHAMHCTELNNVGIPMHRTDAPCAYVCLCVFCVPICVSLPFRPSIASNFSQPHQNRMVLPLNKY